jgi:prepilin-type N-terminal cleavage/methylation domain-containing protein
VKTSRAQRGFTLIELLVVIGLIALLAAITVPALNAIRRGDAIVAATRQLLDDVGHARQLAISRHTTVYMIFCPADFWNNAAFNALPQVEKLKATNLFAKQLVGYTFVTLRSVGDQPGRISPDYIGPWRVMPENTFILTNKFAVRTATLGFYDPPLPPFTAPPANPPPKFSVRGFERLNTIPFPSEQAYDPYVPARVFPEMPYIAFNYLGQLTSGEDEFIPIARGSVAHVRDAQKVPQQGIPVVIENPASNGTNAYNLIHIDWLTGRARLEHQEISGS